MAAKPRFRIRMVVFGVIATGPGDPGTGPLDGPQLRRAAHRARGRELRHPAVPERL